MTELADKLRGLMEKATAGPWAEKRLTICQMGPSGPSRHVFEQLWDNEQGEADAALIVELVNNADSILAALDAVAWRPIETFAEPTSLSSGCGVLVADSDGNAGEAYYRNYGDETDGWWWSNTSWGDYPEPSRPSPTHWKPLGPLPAQPTDEGDK